MKLSELVAQNAAEDAAAATNAGAAAATDGDAKPELPAAHPQTRINEMRAALEAGKDPLAIKTAADDAGGEGDAEGGEGDEGKAADDPPAEVQATDDGAAKDDAAKPDDNAEGKKEGDETVEKKDTDEPSIVVKLPGRHPEDEAFELEVGDEETAERLRELANNGMRRAEFNKQMEAAKNLRAEADYVVDSLTHEPQVFFAEHVGEEHYVGVIELLASKLPAEQFAELAERFRTWEEDPKDRELAAFKKQDEVNKRRDDARKKREDETAKADRAAVLVQAIEDLIPDSMEDRRSNQFFTIAKDEIKTYVRAHGITALPAEQVPVILEKAGILGMFGIAAPANGRKQATPPAASGKPAAEAKPTPEQQKKAQDGAKQVQDRAGKRKDATAVAPGGGTGTAVTRAPEPPKGQSIAQRIAWAKKAYAGT